MSCTVELPILRHGRVAVMHVSSCHDGQWLIAVEVDGRELGRACCSTWQRVEHLRHKLEREIGTPPTDGRHGHAVLAASVLIAMIAGAAGLEAQPAHSTYRGAEQVGTLRRSELVDSVNGATTNIAHLISAMTR